MQCFKISLSGQEKLIFPLHFGCIIFSLFHTLPFRKHVSWFHFGFSYYGSIHAYFFTPCSTNLYHLDDIMCAVLKIWRLVIWDWYFRGKMEKCSVSDRVKERKRWRFSVCLFAPFLCVHMGFGIYFAIPFFSQLSQKHFGILTPSGYRRSEILRSEKIHL